MNTPQSQPTLRTLTVETSAPPVAENVEIRNQNAENTLDFIASDATLDRCDEIIEPSGWQLENYRRNPVFQNSHQYGDILFTLGKALITEVRGGKLFQRIQFATDINPMARIAYGLYQAKYLNAVSVGFIPIRWEDESSSSSISGSQIPRRRYVEQELLEVSAVGIPANPNALQLGLKSGVISRPDVKELSDLLKLLITSSATKPTNDDKTRQLLTLARTIRDALR